MAHDHIKADSLTLDNCAKEPIHIPGTIQPFGFLMACDLGVENVFYASDNTQEYFNRDLETVLNSPVSKLFDRSIIHQIRNVLSSSTTRYQRERVGLFTLNEQTVEVYAHHNADDYAIIELERIADRRSEDDNTLDRMRIFLAKASAQESIKKLLEVCAHGLYELTGYDRVMSYRYASNGDGEVVAEARNAEVSSFLGLRYPSYDVPAQARALQVKNPVRLLIDVNQTPIKIHTNDGSDNPLDIGLAHLRGISPIHVEYLKNMGVSATLTLGIVVDGQLWGMFACHNMTPRVISSSLRITVDLFAQMISLVIKQKLEIEKTKARQKAAEARKQILAETDASNDLLHAFPDMAPILSNVLNCDGLAVMRDEKVQQYGSTPDEQAIVAIGRRKLDEEDLLEETACLSKSGWIHDQKLNNSAGCMHIRCTAAYPLQLMFFKDAKTHNIKWAGKPQKLVSDSKFGPRLSPRGSFDAYVESQKHYSDEWEHDDFQAGRELQILLTQITAKGERAQMARHKDLASHRRQQDLMIAELNHRVKNILALIKSLSRQAKQSSASLESYAKALEERISALASAHDLAVSDTMQGVSLRHLLETELQPYISDAKNPFLINGPTVGLRADVAPMIALVIHEIVTNATKHGSLSVEDGIVNVKWSVADDGLSFEWRELDGPKVKEPSRFGFGRALIEKAIPYEFDGQSKLEYKPTGVKFSFSLPNDTLIDLTQEKPIKLKETYTKIESAAEEARVLIVEDNIVLAMDMVESVSRLGASKIETASTLRDAFKFIESDVFDFVVLDLNLRGEVSFDFARELFKRNVPFFFVTGYGSSLSVPVDIQTVKILTKPVDEGTLSTTISDIYQLEKF